MDGSADNEQGDPYVPLRDAPGLEPHLARGRGQRLSKEEEVRYNNHITSDWGALMALTIVRNDIVRMQVDAVVKSYIHKNRHAIYEINETLFNRDFPLLGAC